MTTPQPPGRVILYGDAGREVQASPPADPAVHERIAQALADPFAFAVALLQSEQANPPTAPSPGTTAAPARKASPVGAEAPKTMQKPPSSHPWRHMPPLTDKAARGD